MKKKILFLSLVFVIGFGNICFLFGSSIVSLQSGNWGNADTWEGGIVPNEMDSVVIRTGDTVVIESSGKKCLCLHVEPGGKLYANKSTTSSYPRNLYIYGSIQCDGQIGNDTIYDLIAFNLEGRYCPISGTGQFDAARIRKYDSTSDTTTVSISMNLNLRYGGTVLCNNRSGTVFIVQIDSGFTVGVPGDGVSAGNVAMDGVNGAASSTGGGIIEVAGSLIVSGIFFMTNSNSSNPVSVEILEGGIIETGSVSCPNSGASGHTLTIHSGGILKFTHGDWGDIGLTNNTYTFYNGSLVWFAGDTSQIIGNPDTYANVKLSELPIKFLQEDLEVAGDLTLLESVSLHAAAGTGITVSGTLWLEDDAGIILHAPQDSGACASLIAEGAIMGNGNITIERWIKGYNTATDGWYHMIASPVEDQPIQPEFVSIPPDPSVDFYRWEPSTTTWVNSKDAAGSWNTGFQAGDNRNFYSGRGYLIAYPQDIVKSFSGHPHSGDVSPVISGGSGFCGFFLTGNPFSSALQGNIENWEKVNVDNAIWVWDGASGNYLTWNGSAGTLPGGIIPCMQGFFVHGNGTDPSLTIPASSQIHAPGTPFLKQDTSGLLLMTVSSGPRKDGVVLHHCAQASPGIDSHHDVLKMNGIPEAPQVYWEHEGTRLSIDSRPEFPEGTILSVGVSAAQNMPCMLSVKGASSFKNGTTLYLKDLVTGVTINLSSTSHYSFEPVPGSEEPRFHLLIGETQIVPEPDISNPWNISWNQHRIAINGISPQDGVVMMTVTDGLGRIVWHGKIDNLASIPLDGSSSGWYGIQLSNGIRVFNKTITIIN